MPASSMYVSGGGNDLRFRKTASLYSCTRSIYRGDSFGFLANGLANEKCENSNVDESFREWEDEMYKILAKHRNSNRTVLYKNRKPQHLTAVHN